jgi:hypothetical protein
MAFTIEKLAVTHTDRDEKGDKIEPEEQQATQICSMPIHVNLGVADFNRVNGGRPIVTRENAGVMAHMGSVKRVTNAQTVARDATVRCSNCRFYDVPAAQSSSKNPHVNDTRTAIAKGLVEHGDTLAAAEIRARVAGRCHQHDGFSVPEFSCTHFRPTGDLRKALGWVRDRIMRAAQGKIE